MFGWCLRRGEACGDRPRRGIRGRVAANTAGWETMRWRGAHRIRSRMRDGVGVAVVTVAAVRSVPGVAGRRRVDPFGCSAAGVAARRAVARRACSPWQAKPAAPPNLQHVSIARLGRRNRLPHQTCNNVRYRPPCQAKPAATTKLQHVSIRSLGSETACPTNRRAGFVVRQLNASRRHLLVVTRRRRKQQVVLDESDSAQRSASRRPRASRHAPLLRLPESTRS